MLVFEKSEKKKLNIARTRTKHAWVLQGGRRKTRRERIIIEKSQKSRPNKRGAPGGGGYPGKNPTRTAKQREV